MTARDTDPAPAGDTDPAPAPPTLGERCVQWCRDEMRRAVTPSRETVAGWLGPCERAGRRMSLDTLHLAGRKQNHCAAAACASALACRDRIEVIPHRYRAAARELMADAIASRTWHGRDAVLAGWRPEVGDLAIYDRSQPGRPETSWWGHVDRVSAVGPDDYENIGANEGPGGAWRIERTRYDHPRLLGFVAYPRPEPVTASPATRDVPPPAAYALIDHQRVGELVALTLDQSEAQWWAERSVG